VDFHFKVESYALSPNHMIDNLSQSINHSPANKTNNKKKPKKPKTQKQQQPKKKLRVRVCVCVSVLCLRVFMIPFACLYSPILPTTQRKETLQDGR